MSKTERSTIAPTGGRERVQLLDALRGFALLGIILANIVIFTGAELMSEEERASQFGHAAAWYVEYAIEWLVSGKFYTTFSLLFGIGFAIQLQRLEAAGRSVSLYVRRLLILFLFGLANLVLIWRVDVLALYAVMGLVLLLFRKASDKTLLLCAVLLWIVPILWVAAIATLGFRPGAPFRDMAAAVFQALNVDVSKGFLPIYSQGDYLLLVKAHLGEIFLRIRGFTNSMRPATVLAMFLLGLWAGRHLVYVKLDEHADLLRKLVKWGFLVGLPSAAAAAWLSMTAPDGPATTRDVLEFAAMSMSHPTLALAYAASFALLWRTGAHRQLAWFAPAGQIPLTNYLLHAAILLFAFFGVGLGLIGKVSTAWIPLIAAALFAALLMFSCAWLYHFRFGPAEWLWRTLTYGKIQPIRKAAGPLSV